MLVALEILLLLGAIMLPLIPYRNRRKAAIKFGRQKSVELSNYVVTADGKLEEITKPHDTSLFQ